MKALIPFFSMLLLHSSLLAIASSEEVSCLDKQPSELEQILQLAKSVDDLNWFGADRKNVLNAACGQGMVINNQNLIKYFDQKPASKILSKNIMGVDFENESEELLEHFALLVGDPSTARPSLVGAKERRFDQKKIPSTCKKVRCALEATFGADQALRLLYMMDRYQINGSHLVYEHASPWKAKELDTVLNALDDMPAFLQVQQKNKPLYHFKRGYTRGDDGVLANALIEIFDSWNEFSEGEKRYTIFHELSHNLSKVSDKIELDNTPEWLALSKWQKKGDEWKPLKIDNLPSQYAATNPSEDFAESLSTYRYNPQAKKILGADKYRFIKENVFLGLEFDQAKNCQKSKWDDLPIAKQIKEDAAQIASFDDAQVASCFKEISKYLEQGEPRQAELCLYGVAQGQAAMKQDTIMQALHPEYIAERVKSVKATNIDPLVLATHPAINKVKLELRDLLATGLVEVIDRQKRHSKVEPSSPEYCGDLLEYKYALSMILTTRYQAQKNNYYLSLDDSHIIRNVCKNLTERKIPLTHEHIKHNLSEVMAGK